MRPGDLLRAVRHARILSQRELAELAGVPHSTVDRIESGQTREPSLRTLERLLEPAGYGFAILDRHGRTLGIDGGKFRIYDRDGRRFPAHLPSNRVRGPWDDWWGWEKIAWSARDPIVPKHTYRRRYEIYPGRHWDERWNDAT